MNFTSIQLSTHLSFVYCIRSLSRQDDQDNATGIDEDVDDLFADLDAENRKERNPKNTRPNRKERRKMMKEKEGDEEAKKRAELELLMIDEGDELKHDFDMKEIRKEAEKKGKKGKKGKKRGQDEVEKDDFEVRFGGWTVYCYCYCYCYSHYYNNYSHNHACRLMQKILVSVVW